MFDPDKGVEICVDLPVTWQNVRCSVIINPEIGNFQRSSINMVKYKMFSYS